jgi:genome maintenance exonuclease 1
LYRVPNGNLYPSVSTILSAGADHSYIDEWRAKVGDKVADEISKKATTRGTLLHENIENRIMGKPETFNMFHVEEKQMFKSALPIVDELEEVIALETQLWSDKLRAAGTVDCCARYKGKLRLIDWKTSGRYKSRDEIHSYFLQTASYAYMIYERTGIAVGDILIVMMSQDDGLLLFEEKVADWLNHFIILRNRVGETHGL